ncbi:MAG: SDR family oxidoreductase [Acidobacteria bacterium]|nr:SDR family oxidoreductase [Acidobacteriota bacterium]
MPLKDFTQKTAVVTGGASGIGLALAAELSQRGCNVALVDCRADRLQEAQRQLVTSGRHVTTHECDIGDFAQVEALCEAVSQAHGHVHLLINNAGVSVAGPFLETSLADFDWLMRVNFWGTVYCCKAFLPRLLNEPEAHVVTMCSSFGLLGFAGKSAYSASKFAVRGFSEALRMELAGTSTGLTVVYPGPVQTNILRDGRTASEAQRQAETEFLSSRAIPATRVARQVARGIQRNAARVRLSLDYAAIDWLTRLSPALAQAGGAWAARRMPF